MVKKLLYLLTTVLVFGRHGNNGNSGNSNNGGSHTHGSTASIGAVQATSRQSLTNGQPAGNLPPGWRYNSDGRLIDANGNYARHPDAPPREHGREDYPSGYRQSTHEYMVENFTLEGQETGGWPTRTVTNPDGTTTTERIPRDELTWVTEDGREIPFYDDKGHVNVTYDHNPPVVQHWNEGGNNMTQEQRNDWYNQTEDMTALPRSENSSKGGADENGQQQTYTQDTGSNYQGRK